MLAQVVQIGLGVLSGVGVSAIAAWFAYFREKRADRRRHREQFTFQIYMLLLDLNGSYFWIASKEMNGEPPPAEIVTKVRNTAWRIADKLREADDVEHLEQVMKVLMDEGPYKTAIERSEAMGVVIDNIGKLVNPRYSKLVHEISQKNIRNPASLQSTHRNNAPCSLW